MVTDKNLMRGIRGATTVEKDCPVEIASAAFTLFETMMEKNRLEPDDVTALFITVTPDLQSAFPAQAIRQVEKYRYLPIMCAQEIPVEGALDRCIRLMLIAFCPDTELKNVHHVYLGQAWALRTDLDGD